MRSSMRALFLPLILGACNLIAEPGGFQTSEAVGSWTGVLADVKPPNFCVESNNAVPCNCPSYCVPATPPVTPGKCVNKLNSKDCACPDANCVSVEDLRVAGTMTLNGDGTGAADFHTALTLTNMPAPPGVSIPGTLAWSLTSETESSLTLTCLNQPQCEGLPAFDKQAVITAACVNSDLNHLACSAGPIGLTSTFTREQ